MRQSMTLLQRGVIHRLRQHGYHSLAAAAAAAWPHNERVKLPNMVQSQHAELREDFERANSQSSVLTD